MEKQYMRKTNVLLIYEGFVASVRLCGYEQLLYLAEHGKISFQHSKEDDLTEGQCQWADVLLFARASSWLLWKTAVCCKKAGKFLIYALDDDLLHIMQDAASAKYYQQKTVRNRMLWFLKNSDILISPSRHLLKKYHKLARRTARIEEPCLRTGWTGLRHAAAGTGKQKLKIGFAGTIDRAGDVKKILEEAVGEFYNKHSEEVEIEFMGVRPELADQWGFACYPYEQDYENYQKRFYQLGWDVGLAPMPDEEFHRNKHYNKYIEYGAAGCAGIYSNVIPYKYVVRDKENGILCENTKQSWMEAMEWCLYHRERLEEIRENVLQDMAQNFQVQHVAEDFVKEVPELVYYIAQENDARMPLQLYKKERQLAVGVEFLSRYGIGSVRKLYEKLSGTLHLV